MMMTRIPFLALVAVAAFTLPAHAETVTVVKTGEIVTTTYKMPSAPVSGTTEMMTVQEVPVGKVTTDEVVEWRDSQPVPQPRHSLDKPLENSHKLIHRYNQ